MSDGSTLELDREEWPLLSFGYVDSHEIAYIHSYQHADGRTLIIGEADFESGKHWQALESWRDGVMLDPGDDIVAAIERVRDRLIERVEASAVCPAKDKMVSHIREAAIDCIDRIPPADSC